MSPAYNGCCYTQHSEMNAIQKLLKKTSIKSRHITCDFYIARLNNNNELRSSKPCEKCLKHMSMLIKYKLIIRNVYYIDSNNKIIKAKFRDLLLDNNKHVSRRFLVDY